MTCAGTTFTAWLRSAAVRGTPDRSATMRYNAVATLSPVLAETKKLQHTCQLLTRTHLLLHGS